MRLHVLLCGSGICLQQTVPARYHDLTEYVSMRAVLEGAGRDCGDCVDV